MNSSGAPNQLQLVYTSTFQLTGLPLTEFTIDGQVPDSLEQAAPNILYINCPGPVSDAVQMGVLHTQAIDFGPNVVWIDADLFVTSL